MFLSCRVQLNLYVCAPFGDYEIDLDVESYSDDSATIVESPASTSWIIRNGHDQVLTVPFSASKRWHHDKLRLLHGYSRTPQDIGSMSWSVVSADRKLILCSLSSFIMIYQYGERTTEKHHHDPLSLFSAYASTNPSTSTLERYRSEWFPSPLIRSNIKLPVPYLFCLASTLYMHYNHV